MSWAGARILEILGSLVAGSMAATGGYIMSQVGDIADARDLLAGGVLIVAAVYIVRWVTKTSKVVEEKWINEIARLEDKNDELEAERVAAIRGEDEWRRKYWELWAQLHGEGRRLGDVHDKPND